MFLRDLEGRSSISGSFEHAFRKGFSEVSEADRVQPPVNLI
jgi:hypothetical protein